MIAVGIEVPDVYCLVLSQQVNSCTGWPGMPFKQAYHSGAGCCLPGPGQTAGHLCLVTACSGKGDMIMAAH